MYKYIVEQLLKHNISDRACFVSDKDALDRFLYMEGNRRIGVIDAAGTEQMLLELHGNCMPELCVLKVTDTALCNQLHSIREKWLITCTEWYRKQCGQEVKKILDQAASPTSMRQEKINFKKEIMKRMTSCRKIFLNHRMDGYDFRDISLDDAIFINCSLIGSNFSHVNLQNTIFVNCKLDGCVWYGAFMNNAFVYQADKPLELENLRGGAVWEK